MQTESPPNSAHSTLGQRLRSQRLAKQLSLDDVAQQLKLPATIVDAMERDDDRVLGAAVYARGRLASYAQLVGVSLSAVELRYASVANPPPELVSRARSSRIDHTLRRFARQGIYIVLTATIVLPVIWLATHNQLPRTAVTLTALDGPAVAVQSSPGAKSIPNRVAEAREEPPVVASMAPFAGYRWNSAESAHSVAAADHLPPAANTSLQLRFSGDSWVDIVGVDGHVIDHGPVAAGSVRNYQTAAVGRVSIGNPGSVLVLRNGEPLDLIPFQNANTTRFTLAPGGTPVPLHD